MLKIVFDQCNPTLPMFIYKQVYNGLPCLHSTDTSLFYSYHESRWKNAPLFQNGRLWWMEILAGNRTYNQWDTQWSICSGTLIELVNQIIDFPQIVNQLSFYVLCLALSATYQPYKERQTCLLGNLGIWFSF